MRTPFIAKAVRISRAKFHKTYNCTRYQRLANAPVSLFGTQYGTLCDFIRRQIMYLLGA